MKMKTVRGNMLKVANLKKHMKHSTLKTSLKMMDTVTLYWILNLQFPFAQYQVGLDIH